MTRISEQQEFGNDSRYLSLGQSDNDTLSEIVLSSLQRQIGSSSKATLKIARQVTLKVYLAAKL